MGIDSMRVGAGRCPPLLVGGLLIACLMLICNWWTLSSENIELLRQIDELQEQLKISADERDQCVTLRGKLEQRYKRTEDEVASLHVRLEQQLDIKKKNDELEESITYCKSELDSLTKLDATKTATLETLRLEKDTINSQLNSKRNENKMLKEELEKVQLEFSNNCQTVKHSPDIQLPARSVVKGQLDLVPENAVKVSVIGQQGLKYHGVPILPLDPPGAVRQVPRYSVTMLKAQTTAKKENDTLNDVDQEIGNSNDMKNAASNQEEEEEIPNDNAKFAGNKRDNKPENEGLWPIVSKDIK